MEVQKILYKITHIDALQTYLKSTGINTDLLPLARLSKSTIDEAIQMLGDISDRLKKIDEERDKPHNEIDYTKIVDLADAITELTNDFYEIIPHSNFTYTKMRPLHDLSFVQEKISMLLDLTDVCFARKLLMAATYNIKDICPLDYCFNALQVLLEPLDNQSGEFKALEKYAQNTGQKNITIKKIYRLQRKGEADRFSQWSALPNHLLLWHGSGIYNFLGILSEGLRVAPPSAPSTGYLYGKGIYFADMLSKSLPYCRNSGLLLLSEVALGQMHQVEEPHYFEAPPEGCNSVMALGTSGPNFSDSVVLHNGVRIPLHAPVTHQNRKIPFNEYIVYNPSQVRMRYLVQVK